MDRIAADLAALADADLDRIAEPDSVSPELGEPPPIRCRWELRARRARKAVSQT